MTLSLPNHDYSYRKDGFILGRKNYRYSCKSVNLVFYPPCCYDSSLILLSFFSKPFLPRARGVSIDTDEYFSIKANMLGMVTNNTLSQADGRYMQLVL